MAHTYTPADLERWTWIGARVRAAADHAARLWKARPVLEGLPDDIQAYIAALEEFPRIPPPDGRPQRSAVEGLPAPVQRYVRELEARAEATTATRAAETPVAVMAEVRARAAALSLQKRATPLPPTEAVAEVFKRDPDLYARYRRAVAIPVGARGVLDANA